MAEFTVNAQRFDPYKNILDRAIRYSGDLAIARRLTTAAAYRVPAFAEDGSFPCCSRLPKQKKPALPPAFVV